MNILFKQEMSIAEDIVVSRVRVEAFDKPRDIQQKSATVRVDLLGKHGGFHGCIEMSRAEAKELTNLLLAAVETEP